MQDGAVPAKPVEAGIMTPKTLYLLVLIFAKLVKRYGIVATLKAVRVALREPPVVDRTEEKYDLFRTL